MAENTEKSPLSTALDQIWKSSGDRYALAETLTSSLQQSEWLVVAGWDTAASFGPVSGRLNLAGATEITVADAWDKTMLQAELCKKNSSGDKNLRIDFVDGSWVVVSSSEIETKEDVLKHAGASLLVAMQLIRDHLDSALLRPEDDRAHRIDEFASMANLRPNHFRRLAAWYSQIASFL